MGTNMGTRSAADNGFTFSIPSREIEEAADLLKKYFRAEYGADYDDRVIAGALRTWLDKRVEQLSEDLGELLTTPNREEAREFRKIVEAAGRSIDVPQDRLEPATADSRVFNGNRDFSIEKLASMTAYIATRGKEIYKTKLNKLLFYADFINYYLHGTSISGAAYVHLPYGPVPDGYQQMLTNLNLSGAISIERQPGFERITAASGADFQHLSDKEIQTLDWVLQNYGDMSASAISALSHREKAYRFTRTGEEIAYSYAKFFEKLPR
jgi:uncharacterized phage-associated protein